MADRGAARGAAHQEEHQNEEKWHLSILRNFLFWWRRYALWLKAVLVIRKEYVPGDTYRFIWQKVPEVKGSFVYYRIFHMLGNLYCFIISFFHIFRGHPEETILCQKHKQIYCFGIARVQYEWCFYVTSIGLTINLVQSVWGLVLTLVMYFRQKMALKQGKDVEDPGDSNKSGGQKKAEEQPHSVKNHGRTKKVIEWLLCCQKRARTQTKDADNLDTAPILSGTKQFSLEHKILSKTGFYWGLHSFGLCLSIIVDIVYWIIIYAPSDVPSTYIINQVTEHGVNLPLMMADYCVVAFPITPSHILFTLIIPAIYIISNYIYYLAGGMNEKRTERYLYSFLNWEKLGITVGYGVGVSLGISISLVIFLIIDHFKFKVRPKALMNSKQSTTSHKPAHV